MNDTRTTYNLAMDRVLKRKLHMLDKLDTAALEKELQSTLVAKAGVSQLPKKHHKLLRTPKVLRQQAVKSVLAVLKAHHTRQQKKNKLASKFPNAVAFKRKTVFRPGLKSKRMTTDSFYVEAVSVKIIDSSTIAMFTRTKSYKSPEILFDSLRVARTVPITCDLKVHLRFGKFYLIVPERREVRDRLRGVRDEVVVLDPGVRVPFTGYTPSGVVEEYGINAGRVADKLLRRIDHRKAALQACALKKEASTEHMFLDRNAKRKLRSKVLRARKRYYEAEDKAKRVVRDFHYKTAHALLSRYENIVLPSTSSHRWRQGRRLCAKVKRRPTTLRMGAFAQRLVQTATSYAGSKVVRCSEAYTSKQCGACGHLNDKLGGIKVFNCRSCGAVADRDVHAARNILLRCLS